MEEGYLKLVVGSIALAGTIGYMILQTIRKDEFVGKVIEKNIDERVIASPAGGYYIKYIDYKIDVGEGEIVYVGEPFSDKKTGMQVDKEYRVCATKLGDLVSWEEL
ncbi:MAG: hypothetical protein MAG795_00910 [Candidatus Woesearchaeota archaeon]|nr:hypothetical protein [Candidatus Woesearchaeota archaeon]